MAPCIGIGQNAVEGDGVERWIERSTCYGVDADDSRGYRDGEKMKAMVMVVMVISIARVTMIAMVGLAVVTSDSDVMMVMMVPRRSVRWLGCQPTQCYCNDYC